MINIFAQIEVADPCCLTSQKSQATLSTFLKYLQSIKLSVLHSTFALHLLSFHLLYSTIQTILSWVGNWKNLTLVYEGW